MGCAYTPFGPGLRWPLLPAGLRRAQNGSCNGNSLEPRSGAV